MCYILFTLFSLFNTVHTVACVPIYIVREGYLAELLFVSSFVVNPLNEFWKSHLRFCSSVFWQLGFCLHTMDSKILFGQKVWRCSKLSALENNCRKTKVLILTKHIFWQILFKGFSFSWRGQKELRGACQHLEAERVRLLGLQVDFVIQ